MAKRNWLTAVWGNPLARDVDRWHATLRMVLILLWALLLPVAAVVGYLVSSDGLAKATAQSHDRISTTAVLTKAAPAMVFTASGVPVLGATAVAAQWAPPDGSTRFGHVPAQAGSEVGTTVQIWTDRSGALTEAPLSASGAVVDGLLVWLMMVVFWGLLLAGVLRISANRFDRRRSAEWDRDWTRVSPIWFPHH